MRWISSCHLFCDPTSGWGTADTNTSNFRNLRSCNSYIYHHWYAPTTASQAFEIGFQTYLMRWISSCNPFCHATSDCHTTGTNISIFGIWNHAIAIFTTFDMLQLQPARHLKLVSRPIWCAKSPRTFHFAMQPVIGVLQAQTSPIFRIWDHATAKFTTFDVLQLQSARHLELGPRHAQCIESLCAIRFVICSVVAVPQP